MWPCVSKYKWTGDWTVFRWDPDVLVGYEIQMLSWGYILKRASKLDIKLCPRLSRLPGECSTWSWTLQNTSFLLISISSAVVFFYLLLKLKQTIKKWFFYIWNNFDSHCALFLVWNKNSHNLNSYNIPPCSINPSKLNTILHIQSSSNQWDIKLKNSFIYLFNII